MVGMKLVIKQKPWNENELRTNGFEYYQRVKEMVMVRQVSRGNAPLRVKVDFETLVIEGDHVMCYEPGERVRGNLDEYEHWPCEVSIFKETYKPWDEPGWKPSPAERDLMVRGCAPVYKFSGVWARPLTEPTYVQSLESPKPARIPAGQWLVIGAQGAPYHMNETAFHARYTLPQRD